MADTLRESGYRPASVTHIHNSVDLQTVAARRSPDDVRRELGIDRETVLIGTAGWLSPDSAQPGLLRAARLMLQKVPAAKFLVIDGSPHDRELLASATALQVDGVCLIPEARTDVHDLMAAVDMFVLPSLHEESPTAILEAMALGKPVVATAVGGVPEIVQHGVTGLLVAPGDEAALADACVELALDRDHAQKLGAQGRRVVAEEFSHERCGGDLMDAYRSVTLATLAQTECDGVVGDPRASLREQPPGAGLAGASGWGSDAAILRVVPPIRNDAGRGSGATIGPADLCRVLAQKLLKHGARAVSRVVERRRMNRIRRNPAALRRALRSAESLLVMCQGNIIRSPFAMQMIRQALVGRAAVAVTSAGLGAVPGTPTHPTALRAASARSVDLSSHHASAALAERVAASDVIFVMDVPQLVAMRERFPDALGKTFLLTCLAPELALEIEDPVNRGEAAYHTCYEHISRAVRPIIRTLAATPAAQSPTP
jgi:protein-tyrosine-phosphatase